MTDNSTFEDWDYSSGRHYVADAVSFGESAHSTSNATKYWHTKTAMDLQDIRRQFADVRFTPGEWTDETVAALRLGWDAGYSTNVIGQWLTMSKNAIVGKSHRVHPPLSARTSPIHRSDQPSVPRPPRVAGPTLPPLRSVAASAEPDALLDKLRERRRLDNIAMAEARRVVPPATPAVPTPKPYARTTTCVFPIGDPGTRGFRYCDEPHRNRSYCDTHTAICYVRTRRQECAET